MKQLDLLETQATHVRRGGLIGKVQAYLEANPWVECGDIAKALDECPVRVSNCLNKLKLEGNAQQRKGCGRSNKSLWAGTSEDGRERREAILTALEPTHDEKVQLDAITRFGRAMRMGYRRTELDARRIGLAGLFATERMEA